MSSPVKGVVPLIAVNEKIINLTGTIEQTSDPLVRKILALRLEELAIQRSDYEEEYDKLLRYKINWEEAMRSLAEFTAWCESVRPNLTDPRYTPSYEEQRNAIERLGIRVTVYKKEHDPRYTVEVGPPEIVSKFLHATFIVT